MADEQVKTLNDSETETVTAGTKKRKGWYVCKHCSHIEYRESDIVNHVKSSHSVEAPARGTDYSYIN